MSLFRVASRYAKSLLELSVERGELEAVHQDMQRLLDLGEAQEEFVLMLQDPVIRSDKKLNVLKSLFSDGNAALTVDFFELLTSKRRENVLMAIAREFHKQYNIHKGIQAAELITTFPIDGELRKSFVEMVKEISGKDKVQLSEKIDEDLIGGFVLTVGDRQIDESLESKLNLLRLRFTQNLYEKKY